MCEQILRGHTDEVWSIRITSDFLLISGSLDRTIRVWRQDNSGSNTGPRQSSSSSSSSQSQSSSAGAGESEVQGEAQWVCEQVIDTTESHDAEEAQRKGVVYSLCCLDGRIVSAGDGNKISVWRTGRERSEDWALHKWFDTEGESVWSLTVSKGKLISGGTHGTVRVWI